jgi:hypothetical protein
MKSFSSSFSLLPLFLLFSFLPRSWSHEDDEEEELDVTKIDLATCIFIIVTLLILITILFEYAQTRIIESASKAMQPVVQSLFAELTILGCLSLITFSISQAGLLSDLSELIFGSSSEGKSYLTELFEQVHYMLFLVMVLFLLGVLLLVKVGHAAEVTWEKYNTIAQDDKRMTLMAMNAAVRPRWWQLWKLINYWKEEEKLTFFGMRREFIHTRSPVPPYNILPPS